MRNEEARGVTFTELADSLESVYGRLEFPTASGDRPYTVINMAMTLDGKVTVGRPGFLLTGSPGDRRAMDELRAACDVVMVGAGTLRHENPVLRVKSRDLQEWRAARGQPTSPRYAVVTNSGELPEAARFFQAGDSIVVAPRALPGERVETLKARAEVVLCGEERVDLAAALTVLRREMGVERLLVEGGPTLSFEVVRGHLAEELFLTLAPLLKGGRDTPTLMEGEGFSFAEVQRARLLSVKHHKGELYLRYRLPGPAGKGKVDGRPDSRPAKGSGARAARPGPFGSVERGAPPSRRYAS